jgi:hypothetical protein
MMRDFLRSVFLRNFLTSAQASGMPVRCVGGNVGLPQSLAAASKYVGKVFAESCSGGQYRRSSLGIFNTRRRVMSNLVSAKQALRAELAHARQGAAYYQSLAETLEEALEKLEHVNEVGTPRRNARRGEAANATSATAAAMPARRGRKPGAAGRGMRDRSLPSTAKDFWPSLITDQPQSASEILQAAVDKLGITPNEDQLKKLQQRATFALNTLVKKKAIEDSGSGRGRRFFRRH